MKKSVIVVFFIIVSSILNAQNGIWGLSSGGPDNTGEIYSYDFISSALTKKYNIPYSTPGSNPVSCIQASNGKIYGLTKAGGINHKGSMFEYDIITQNYNVLLEFNSINGAFPYGSLVQASNGKLYGMTSAGGNFNFGVLFEFDITSAQYIIKKHFNNTAVDGAVPYGSLIETSPNIFYGLTSGGGSYSNGIMFEYNLNSNIFTKKYDFSVSISANGGVPKGTLLKANNGNLFGTTFYGGLNGKGVLFEYNVTTSVLTKKKDFNTVNGENPTSDLIQHSNGKIYGLTYKGGLNSIGTLYEYDPISLTFNVRYDINGSVSGVTPVGKLIDGNNGSLYFVTSDVSYAAWGKIMEYNLTTSNIYSRYQFNNTDGKYPIGSLILANNGNILGVTAQGGYKDVGVFFSFDISSNIFSKLFDFNNIFNGSVPSRKMVQGNNGKLYGMTISGGVNNLGTIFEFDPVSLIYTKKFDFTSVSGSKPRGSLLLANNSKFYGMTNYGGLSNKGTIFEFDPSTGIVSVKIDLSASNGSYPEGSLMKSSTGRIFGVTIAGGIYGQGVIFEYEPTTNSYTIKVNLDGSILGGRSLGSLTENSNGKLYGLTEQGGLNNLGVLFEYDPILNTCIKKIDFDGATMGSSPKADLISANNGKLYGLTSAGGVNGAGVLFEYDILTSTLLKKIDFNGSINGANPYGTLIQSSNGKIYGTTEFGGLKSYGTLFEYDVFTNILNKRIDFDSITGFGGNDLIELCLTPNTSSNIVGTTQMCQINAANLTYSLSPIVNATSYTWNLPSGSVILSSGSSNLINVDFSSLSSGVYTIGISGSNSCGLGNVTTLSLTIGVNFSLSTTSNSICKGSSVDINAIGANSYTWNTGATTTSINITPTITTTYTVTGTDLNNCSNSQSVTVTVDNTCQDVWPGDANSDGIADNLDVLELGLHYMQTGAPRASISNLWQSYYSANWSGTITNGKNLNHSNCNGDGIVNDDDTLAIFNNYNLTHAFKPAQTTTNPALSIVADQSSVAKGTWGTSSIFLGDATTTINTINGVAFTVNYDNTLLETDSVWIEYPTSFINSTNQNLKFRKRDFTNGKLYTATTHTISGNVNGYGKIATLHYKIKSALTTDNVLNLSISQANQSNASGVITPLTAGSATLMALGTSITTNLNALTNGNYISIHPNPTNGVLTINSTTELQKIEVMAVTGQLLISEVPSSTSHVLHLDHLANGVYFVNLYQNNRIVKREKIILNK